VSFCFHKAEFNSEESGSLFTFIVKLQDDEALIEREVG